MPPKPKIYVKKSFVAKPMSTEITSASYLIIVESPSKCSKIESYLGSDYRCIASKGHIRELVGLKSIDVSNNFQPTFTTIKEKADHVSQMRNVITNFPKQNIILATDDDREGEGIAWHICETFKLPIKTTKRILFHEITQSALLDAVKTPTIVNMSLVRAQHARQILDILVGFKISPHLWKHVRNGKTNALSAGRCQTPALRLVYDNENAREKSGLETKYKTRGYFTSQDLEFILGHEFDTKEEMENFLRKSVTHKHVLSMGVEKDIKKGSPKPFNTSKLLQAASSQLHTTPKQTMQLCQSLYQNGLITYMRTDSTKYAGAFLETTRKYITQTYGNDKFVGNLPSIENKDKSNPHEGIRVTDIRVIEYPKECSGKEASMYKFIWRNTLESCMSDAKYKSTTVSITSPDVMSKKIKYTNTIEIPTFLGWKQVSNKLSDEGELSARKMFIKGLTEQAIPYNRIESEVVVRNKIPRYTEASLIQTMEELGIGRPSTFATLVDTIQERGYVKCTDVEGETRKCVEFTLRANEILDKRLSEKVFGSEKSKLVIQPIGILGIEFLVKHFEELFSYDYTKNMESRLDIVARCETDCDNWYDVCSNCVSDIDRLSKPVSKLAKETYQIDENHEVVFGQYGPTVKETTEDGTVRFHTVKNPKISLDKLRTGEYNLDDLLAIKKEIVGEYEGQDLKVKTGKFGPYFEWGGNRESLRDWKQPLDELTLSDAIEIIDANKEKTKTKTILRTLGANMSVRSGKFGPYIFYKTATMKKPKFLPLKKCPHVYDTCEESDLLAWVTEKYNIGL